MFAGALQLTDMVVEYFSHDFHARSDPKLIKLLMKEGVAGIGVFWCIIEMLYEQGGVMEVADYETIAFELRSDCDLIKRVIENYGLFIFDDEKFYSKAVVERLEERDIKSEKASKSANERWNKYRKNKAANRLQCDGITKRGEDTIEEEKKE